MKNEEIEMKAEESRNQLKKLVTRRIEKYKLFNSYYMMSVCATLICLCAVFIITTEKHMFSGDVSRCQYFLAAAIVGVFAGAIYQLVELIFFYAKQWRQCARCLYEIGDKKQSKSLAAAIIRDFKDIAKNLCTKFTTQTDWKWQLVQLGMIVVVMIWLISVYMDATTIDRVEFVMHMIVFVNMIITIFYSYGMSLTTLDIDDDIEKSIKEMKKIQTEIQKKAQDSFDEFKQRKENE